MVRPEARPGTIALPLGTGHRDYGRYARGRGGNPLDLIGADSVEGTTAPVLSGLACEYCAPVRRSSRSTGEDCARRSTSRPAGRR